MTTAEDVIHICQTLTEHHIQVWLTGGWGIDALLGQQTRPHKDLDIILLVDDVVRMRELLSAKGYALKQLWSEDRLAVDAHGAQISTAFVLQDPEGREIDAHAMRMDDHGDGIPAWTNDEGLIFNRQHLAGEGWIAGQRVCCLSPAMQVLCHTGYDLPDEQVRDLKRLHEKFGLDRPGECPGIGPSGA